jgi:hypothetical protein
MLGQPANDLLPLRAGGGSAAQRRGGGRLRRSASFAPHSLPGLRPDLPLSEGEEAGRASGMVVLLACGGA